MKKKLPKIFIGLIFIIGLGIMLYPIISNLYIEHHQGNIIDEYNKTVESMPDDTLEKEREKAEGYNKMLTGNMIITDPFDPEAQKKLEENSDYYNILNIGNDNIIGYIKIPKINVSLPIYHGTSEDVLKRGVGHLQNTSFPIGGEGTHAVLSGHTGLSSAKLFTDLDKLEEGELFFIEVLGEKLAYKIDQIKIVEPSETSDLVIKSGEDYVTLVTCTPYGINSHRLLVRGTRIPYTEDVEKEAKNEENSKVKSTWRDEYFKALAVGLGGLSILGVIFIIIVLIKKKGRRKK
ncbi:MAG: class C sortase [Clostridium sp.]|jgi:sortase A|nr:class C sortase [Clostridium sp.]